MLPDDLVSFSCKSFLISSNSCLITASKLLLSCSRVSRRDSCLLLPSVRSFTLVDRPSVSFWKEPRFSLFTRWTLLQGRGRLFTNGMKQGSSEGESKFIYEWNGAGIYFLWGGEKFLIHRKAPKSKFLPLFQNRISGIDFNLEYCSGPGNPYPSLIDPLFISTKISRKN